LAFIKDSQYLETIIEQFHSGEEYSEHRIYMDENIIDDLNIEYV
jgi:hypothetical protein